MKNSGNNSKAEIDIDEEKRTVDEQSILMRKKIKMEWTMILIYSEKNEQDCLQHLKF